MNVRRAPALLVIVGLLAAGGLIDRARRHHASTRASAAPVAVPEAAPPSAVSSTWYCTGATAAGGGQADGTVVVANAGDRQLTGTVTVIPASGDPRQVPLLVGPVGRATVRLGDVVSAQWVSAIVDLDGGLAAAELATSGPFGPSVSPCASSASDHWYFPQGSTTKDASEVLSLFNPFPEDAIVDLSFSTDEGQVVPEGLSGLVVKGRHMQSVAVGDYVHRREAVAATVVARIGRLVVTQAQWFDGSAGRKGLAVGLGAPALASTWYFPEGLVADGIVERYWLFNPGKREVAATLDLTLEQGAAEPIQVQVPAQSALAVVANDEQRIPKGVPHAVTVHAGAAGLAVARTIDAGSPANRAGFAAALGAAVPSTRWALAAGSADDTMDEWVVVQNPTARRATLSSSLLNDGTAVPIDGMQDLTLEGGQRLAVRLGDRLKRPATPLVVSSNVPVIVERGLYVQRGLGATMGMGVVVA